MHLPQHGELQLDSDFVKIEPISKIVRQEENNQELCNEIDAFEDDIKQCIMSDKQFLQLQKDLPKLTYWKRNLRVLT